MRDASIAVLREIGVETGGSNVQFAVNPADGRLVVIEMNPRVSRSSALGLEGDRLPDRQGRGQARGRLHARRDRQRHHRRRDARLVRADHRLRRHQDSALRLREIPRRRRDADHLDEVGRRGDGDRPHLPGKRCRRRCARWRPASPASTRSPSRASARATTRTPSAPRSARRRRTACSRSRRRCGSASPTRRCTPPARSIRGSWRRSAASSRPRPRSAAKGLPKTAGAFRRLKAMGFSDAAARQAHRAFRRRGDQAAPRARRAPGVQAHRHLRGRVRLADRLHVFDLRDAVRRPGRQHVANEARPSDKKKVVILGGGPNRIGQGIEFDYCCCHAAFALKDAGYETIMVNCNPETVSTDYDTSDRLYFEPLTAEDVLEIIDTERAQRHPARRHRAVRRPDAAQARRGAGEGQGADPRHLARRHRPRRGPRPLQAAAREAQAAPAAKRHRGQRRSRRAPPPTASAIRS